MKNTSNEEQNTRGQVEGLRAYRAPALLLAVSFIFSGCVAGKAQKVEPKGTGQAQVEAGLIPCTTDADCEAKNDKPLSPCLSDGQDGGVDCTDGGVNKGGTAFFYCEAITGRWSSPMQTPRKRGRSALQATREDGQGRKDRQDRRVGE